MKHLDTSFQLFGELCSEKWQTFVLNQPNPEGSPATMCHLTAMKLFDELTGFEALHTPRLYTVGNTFISWPPYCESELPGEGSVTVRKYVEAVRRENELAFECLEALTAEGPSSPHLFCCEVGVMQKSKDRDEFSCTGHSFLVIQWKKDWLQTVCSWNGSYTLADYFASFGRYTFDHDWLVGQLSDLKSKLGTASSDLSAKSSAFGWPLPLDLHQYWLRGSGPVDTALSFPHFTFSFASLNTVSLFRLTKQALSQPIERQVALSIASYYVELETSCNEAVISTLLDSIAKREGRYDKIQAAYDLTQIATEWDLICLPPLTQPPQLAHLSLDQASDVMAIASAYRYPQDRPIASMANFLDRHHARNTHYCCQVVITLLWQAAIHKDNYEVLLHAPNNDSIFTVLNDAGALDEVVIPYLEGLETKIDIFTTLGFERNGASCYEFLTYWLKFL